uniref:Uncharacterized protein n=1 Tax=viral metagenome TaxID=1070528 RepID=A0A6C0LC88_9ZZZZ
MPRKSPSSKNDISSKNSKNSKDSKYSKSSNKSNKSTGGVNLTPLISALLLAGIKLSLEQNKKTKKVASNSKSTKTKPRRQTI